MGGVIVDREKSTSDNGKRETWGKSFANFLASPESESFSEEGLRSERKAIQRPSGDHLGSTSCPDWVSWMSEPVLASSR